MSWGKIKIDPADAAFSKWVRLRDGKCRRCGSLVQLNEKGLPVSHQASHFQGRGKEGTRFEPLNVDCLCGGCHRYFTSHPGDHYQWQLRLKGQKIVDQLVLQSNTYCKKDRKMQAMVWKAALKEDYGIVV